MAASRSEKSKGSRPFVFEALRGMVRLDSCFPPFLEKGGVVVRVRWEWGGWGGDWLGGKGRTLERKHACSKGHGRTGATLERRMLSVSGVGSFTRIAAWELGAVVES